MRINLELCEATCEMLVEMHEWMVGRADMEGVQASAALKDEVDALVQREEEQGLSSAAVRILAGH
jgi:hypothetical protein